MHHSFRTGIHLSDKALDSWLEECGFNPWQEPQENFLVQNEPSAADSYSGICSIPVLPWRLMQDPGHSTESAGGAGYS